MLRKSSTHTPAFTLVELMITLALVGFVLSLGLLVVNVLGRMHQRFDEQVDQTYGLLQVRNRLQQDLLSTHDIRINPMTYELLDPKGEVALMYYWQDSLVIRRHAERLDTLAGKWSWHPAADPNLIHWTHYPSQLPLVLRLPFTATLRTP